MIEARSLDYEFDEESLGFEAPPQRPAPARSWAQRLAVATVAAGVLLLVVSWTSVEV